MAERTVIVGSGHAGVQVAATLRDLGYVRGIDLVGDETDLPYQRPPLSKSPQRPGVGTLVPLRPETFYSGKGVSWWRGEVVTAIDRRQRRVLLESGRDLGYDHLVLALGATARRLPVAGSDGPGVHVLRTFQEACALWHSLGSARSAVVVGGGFLGLEFAAAARRTGVTVTVVELATRLLPRAVSEPVADALARHHAELGVQFVLGDSVASIDRDDDSVVGVTTAGGRAVPADLVLVAVGAAPRTDVAFAAGLDVDDGIVVDSSMRTSDPAISAVGDCARVRFGDGRSSRLESVASAVDQASAAARHIAGAAAVTPRPPWFWSEQGDSMLQIVGLAAPDDDVVLRPGSPGELAAFRFRRDALVCVETVNRPRDHLVARRLLAGRAAISRAAVADPSIDLRALAAVGGRAAPSPCGSYGI